MSGANGKGNEGDKERIGDDIDPDREKLFEDLERTLGAAADKVTKAFEEHMEKNPEWFMETVLSIIHFGLVSLRESLEDEASGITWADPFVELRYPLKLKYKPEWAKSIDLKLAPLLKKPTPSEAARENLLREDCHELHLVVLHTLTNRTALLKRGNTYQPCIPADEQEKLEKLPDAERRARMDELLRPYRIGAVEVEIPEGLEETGGPVPGETVRKLLEETAELPTLTFTGEKDGKPLSGSIVTSFHPILLDEDERRAYSPVVVGLQFDPLSEEVLEEDLDSAFPDPSAWTKEDREAFWKELLRGFEERAPEAPEAAAGPKAETSATLPIPSVQKPDPVRSCTFPVPLERTIADTNALEFVNTLHKVRLPARRWSSLKSWEDLKREEVSRIFEEEGEAALEDLRTKTVDPNARGPLLKDRWRNGGKTRVLELTAEAERLLKVRNGLGKGYRYVDPLTGHEYLTRLFQVGRGYVEVGLSWYGRAGPWVADWRLRRRDEAQAARRREHQPFLFEELDEEERAGVERLLRRVQLLDDGQKIMEMVLGQVGLRRQNPIHVPAVALKVLLELETDPDWKARVEGGLNALRACEFRLKSFGMEMIRGYGYFLGEWWYKGTGPGDHGDGDYYLHVLPGFLGCLSVFESGKTKLSSGREITHFDFGKKLSKEEKKSLGWNQKGEKRSPEATFSRFDAGRVFYNAAEKLSPARSNLVSFLETELTLNRDPVSKHFGDWKVRQAIRVKGDKPDANEPRLYGRDVCPLLPAGKLFHGALGHFKRNPETGRTLAGTPRRSTSTGGAHAAGLLHEMGHHLPPGGAFEERRNVTRQALEDIKAVVVDNLGGVVAVKVKGKAWWPIEEAATLPERELLERASFFFFLPETWREARKEKWEARQAERAARGETTYAWKVPKTTEEADRARAALASGIPETEPPAGGLASAPLRYRFRAARLERSLSLAQAGALFGVSKKTVSLWETGPEPDEEGKVRGDPIPRELIPFVERWVETRTPPTPEELAGRKTAKGGGRKKGLETDQTGPPA